tara:strand:- start:279 stop:431 length:153 start_codon:yes stop_codon:yes gene_type:complete
MVNGRSIKVTVELMGDEQDAEEVLDLLRFIADTLKTQQEINVEEEECTNN